MSESATDFSCTPIGGEDTEGHEVFADFKDSQGRFRTQSLFWESRHPDYKCYFTTKKHPHEGCISMYQKYMEVGDPTEYKFAQRVLGSWDHWKALCGSKWFSELLTEWRAELQVKMESERYWEMKDVKDTCSMDSPQSIQATKWLADRYTPEKETKRGRPSNAERLTYLKEVKDKGKELDFDAKLVGLK